jgi:hypothetical protein
MAHPQRSRSQEQATSRALSDAALGLLLTDLGVFRTGPWNPDRFRTARTVVARAATSADPSSGSSPRRDTPRAA